MDDLDRLVRDAVRLVAAARRLAWGDQKQQSPAEGGGGKERTVIRRDDIKLFQPEESGLEYPVIAQWDEEHGAWQVLKQLDPKKPRGA